MKHDRRSSLPLLLVVLFLGGCGGLLERDAPEKTRYMLEARREESEKSDGTRHLEVRTFAIAVAYSSDSFVYRQSSGAFTTDFYNEFLVGPGMMLADATRNWFARSGLFATAQSGGSRIAPTHQIEGDVIELYGDYSEKSAAVLRARFVLLDSVTSSLIFQKEYAAREDLANDEPATLVEGWNRALESILRSLEGDIRRILATSS